MCLCGAIMRRSELATGSGGRKIVFECTRCNRCESELRSRGGALIRWRNFVQTRGDSDDSLKAAPAADRAVVFNSSPGDQYDPFTEWRREFGHSP